MVERYLPIKQPKRPSNPVVLLRRFARSTLAAQEGTDNFKKAVVEFAEAAFCIREDIGWPVYHIETAMRKARKLGLSEAETIEALQNADRLFTAYEHFSGGGLLEPSQQENLQILEKVRRAIEEITKHVEHE